MADTLCVAATGGAASSRQLYTDADQHIQYLHVALVLNGIHHFIGQSDLAQRCLPIHLLALSENDRKSETQLIKDLQADMPAIFRGLLNLIADILKHLPTAKITNPERMIDFVHWLAAMEKVFGAPAGAFQSVYSEILREGQLDSLLDNPLASAVIEFAHEHIDDRWSGMPAKLLTELNGLVSTGTQRSKYWPQNASSLSKRLMSLEAGLLSQGIRVERTRGKHRQITITKLEEAGNE